MNRRDTDETGVLRPQQATLPAGGPMHPTIVRALGVVKFVSALACRELAERDAVPQRGFATEEFEAWIVAAVDMARGRCDEQFSIDAYHSGFGAAVDELADRLICDRAEEALGNASIGTDVWRLCGAERRLRMDSYGIAVHLASVLAIANNLAPAIQSGIAALEEPVADATRKRPIDQWRSRGVCADQLKSAANAASQAMQAVTILPSDFFAGSDERLSRGTFVRILSEQTGVVFVDGVGRRAGQGVFQCHNRLREIAMSLWDAAGSFRGTAAGTLAKDCSVRANHIGRPELHDEMLQAAAHVCGNDHAIGMAVGLGESLGLPGFPPICGQKIIESLMLLNNLLRTLAAAVEPVLRQKDVRRRAKTAMSAGTSPAIVADALRDYGGQ